MKQKPDLTETEPLLLQIIEYLLDDNRKRAKKANLPIDEVRTMSLDKTTLPFDAQNKGVARDYSIILIFSASVTSALGKLPSIKKWNRIQEVPYLPLHNNPAEQEQRPRVIKKKSNYGTRSLTGLKTLDPMQSLMRTCGKLGLSFWHFLTDRLSRANQIPSLADLII